jgi:sortase A
MLVSLTLSLEMGTPRRNPYTRQVSFSPDDLPTRRAITQRGRTRSAAILGVTGEVLITLGLIIGFFWVWFVFINDVVAGAGQNRAGAELSESFQTDADLETFGKAWGSSAGRASQDEPPVVESGPVGQAFATLYVPRFGADYQRPIGEGVDLATVLNSPRLGVGRYPETQDLGELGNFAIAGHRTTYGAAFADIGELRVGDRIYVETREGWFVYRFRNLEYVWPDAINVLNEIPRFSGIDPDERILTMTSCHPRFSEAERVIAYSVFDSWYPRSEGPPSEISHLVGFAS